MTNACKYESRENCSSTVTSHIRSNGQIQQTSLRDTAAIEQQLYGAIKSSKNIKSDDLQTLADAAEITVHSHDESEEPTVPVNSYYDNSILFNADTSTIVFLGPSSPRTVPRTDTATRIYFNMLKSEVMNNISVFKRNFLTTPAPTPEKSSSLNEQQHELEAKVNSLLRILNDDQEPTSKWYRAFDLLPPLNVCLSLKEQFLNFVNPIFHCTTVESITKDIEDTYKFQQELLLRALDPPPLNPIHIHKLCMVLMMLHCAYLSCKDETLKNQCVIQNSIYLGSKLALIGLAAVNSTDIHFESTLSLIQLGSYLCIFKDLLIIDDDNGFGTSALVSRVCQASKAIGLLRDPLHFDNSPIALHGLWRQILRSVNFVDAFYSLDTGYHPVLACAYVDTNLDDYQLDSERDLNDDRDILGVITEQVLSKVSAIARVSFDTVLLVPATKVALSTLQQIHQKIDQLETSVSDIDSLVNIKKKIELPQKPPHTNSLAIMAKILLCDLRLQLTQACCQGPQDHFQLLQTALKVLEVSKYYIDNLEQYKSFEYFVISVIVKYSQRAWKIILKLVKDAGDTPIKNADVSKREFDRICNFVFKQDVLQLLLKYYEWLTSLSSKSYGIWKNHLIMHSMMSLTLRSRQVDVKFTELQPPLQEVWLDWLKREVTNTL